LSAKQEPDDGCVAQFRAMTEQFFTQLVGEIMADNPEPHGYLMDYPSEQDAWSDSKKLQYEKNLFRVFYDTNYKDYIGSFTLMVKTGEVQSTPALCIDSEGFVVGQSSRPRAIMNPTKGAYGVMQAMQRSIFPLLKKFLPGFIHSMTTQELLSLIKSRITKEYKAISIDGSAFDSSQFAILMNYVDDVFWIKMRPFIREIIRHNWEAMHNVPANSIDVITERLMNALLQSKNIVFIHLPGVNAPRWPTAIEKQFYRDVEQAKKWKDRGPQVDWVYMELTGTTFSGHSTKTTLGNTLRTLCYSWYYIMRSGVAQEPWNSERVFSIASGDDCVIFVAPEYAQQVYDAILLLSTRNTQPQQVGLGQCIKEISIGKFYEMEFCSKWSHSHDGTLDSWNMCRSIQKLMTTK